MIKELETWFSGGGLADIGFAAAGLTPTYAIELEDAIAQCYRQNLGDHCVTGDVTKSPLAKTPYWFHASPPCTNASVAKTDGGETELDIQLARAVVRGIERKSPWFSLENVWGYRTFESFRIICESLSANGYNFAYWHLNAADYGVPQTRKRLILVASRVKRVVQPQPTHGKDPGLFWLPWVGWYEAIADLIHTLPETRFAKWQIERLPEGVNTFLVGDQTSGDRGVLTVDRESPSFTVDTRPANKNRAFLVDGIANSNGATATVVTGDRPSYTVKASSGKQASRAWIQQGKVVAITPRCLARFQSVPDSYQLPEKNPLACKIIGNGVPSKLMQALTEAQSA